MTRKLTIRSSACWAVGALLLGSACTKDGADLQDFSGMQGLEGADVSGLAPEELEQVKATVQRATNQSAATLSFKRRVTPIIECIESAGTNRFNARFGYKNNTTRPVSIPVGVLNFFLPKPINRGQPTNFAVGTKTNVFKVQFACNSVLVWQLDGGVAIAHKGSKKCGTTPVDAGVDVAPDAGVDVKPDTAPDAAMCPASCNDNNPCTSDHLQRRHRRLREHADARRGLQRRRRLQRRQHLQRPGRVRPVGRAAELRRQQRLHHGHLQPHWWLCARRGQREWRLHHRRWRWRTAGPGSASPACQLQRQQPLHHRRPESGRAAARTPRATRVRPAPTANMCNGAEVCRAGVCAAGRR